MRGILKQALIIGVSIIIYSFLAYAIARFVTGKDLAIMRDPGWNSLATSSLNVQTCTTSNNETVRCYLFLQTAPNSLLSTQYDMLSYVVDLDDILYDDVRWIGKFLGTLYTTDKDSYLCWARNSQMTFILVYDPDRVSWDEVLDVANTITAPE